MANNDWHGFLVGTGKFKEDEDSATFEKVRNKKTIPGELATRPQDKQRLWLAEAGITSSDDVEAILSGLSHIAPSHGPSQGAGYTVANPQIIEFWNALKASTIDKYGVLSLGNVNFFGDRKWGTKLYVRNAYIELAEIILNQTKQGITRTVIVGNPGIGKSLFQFYLLKLLLDQNKTVVYHRQTMTEWYLFTPDGVWEGANGTQPQHLPDALRDHNTWYLVDSLQPFEWKARTVLVSSPRPVTYRDYQKSGAKTRYMPVWTEEEIDHCRKFVYPLLREDETKERYTRWGGIPRYVLEFTDPSSQALLLDAIKAARIESILCYTGEENNPDDISHKILHLVVHYDEDNVLDRYIHKHVEFSSYYVAQQILDKLEKHSYYKLLQQTRQNELSPGGRGGNFEMLAHNILQRGGKFTMRNLETNLEESLELPTRDWCIFDKEEDLSGADDSQYLKPRAKNFRSIDAVLTTPIYFQMTTSLRHGILLEGVRSLVQVFRAKKLHKLVFVVPSDIYDDFACQIYYDAKKVVAQNVPEAVSGVVVQYVLKIPLDYKEDTIPTLPSLSVSTPKRTLDSINKQEELCGAKLTKSRRDEKTGQMRFHCTKLAGSCSSHMLTAQANNGTK